MGFVDDLRSAAGFGEEYVKEDSWENRLAEAAYTPPSGIRITFDYENIQQKASKKTTAFDFPDANGTLVQDHGYSKRRFPHRVFFTGPDHDRQADVFLAALMERGAGRLESPLYGEHLVVPFGDITRRDDLKNAANQTVFEVTFFETIDAIYPEAQSSAAGAVVTALELFGELGDAEFASKLSINSVGERQSVIDTINNLIDKVESELEKVAAVQDVVADAFQDAVDTVNRSIDVLIATPLTLARETRNLIQAPAKALANVQTRLDGYGNLATEIFSAPDAVSEPGGPGNLGPRIESALGVGNNMESPNKFHARDLFAGNYLAGTILSTLYTGGTSGGAAGVPSVQAAQENAAVQGVADGNTLATAPQALAAAEYILDQFEAWRTWRDSNFESIQGDSSDYLSTPANVDPGGAYAAMQQTALLAAGYLIELSFTLLREYVIILDRDRSIVDLCYELYGDVDSTLDFFIDSNNLSLSEIIEVKRGRAIRYYV